ncbi:ABC transporter ATP-binding protein [Pseudomonas sp. GX19020]|uniref:ABC transporter ATP-binding protein n=1 Tax=Pseudomonadota TaxID=1224 RepID=UPI00089D3F4C|nr:MULTISPECIES: ABC transporter ATP-binding protein [Pseudomonadota]MCL4069347.1 ABC transporter ATP-binding protein [Pseudomonas sp. GX19020]SED26029.1 sulfonate transport system ATP-binding protein [Rhodobacter sp. 24-YEA-8]
MLTIRNLGKTYETGTRALAGINLTVAPGEILAIVGGSGCGKSTLLRILAGLEQATHGEVAIDETALDGPHEKIGIIFQEARLFPWLTVRRNVGFGLAGLPHAVREARISATLARVGLTDKANALPRQLSGGQAQRVSIARALVTEPEVLLLDEPFSALDAFTKADLQQHLLQIHAKTEPSPTLIIVTHDIEEAILLADRVIVMCPNPGRIAEDFPVDLPRRRARGDEGFEALRHRILDTLNLSHTA